MLRVSERMASVDGVLFSTTQRIKRGQFFMPRFVGAMLRRSDHHDDGRGIKMLGMDAAQRRNKIDLRSKERQVNGAKFPGYSSTSSVGSPPVPDSDCVWSFEPYSQNLFPEWLQAQLPVVDCVLRFGVGSFICIRSPTSGLPREIRVFVTTPEWTFVLGSCSPSPELADGRQLPIVAQTAFFDTRCGSVYTPRAVLRNNKIQRREAVGIYDLNFNHKAATSAASTRFDGRGQLRLGLGSPPVTGAVNNPDTPLIVSDACEWYLAPATFGVVPRWSRQLEARVNVKLPSQGHYH
ncbi:hypothetical protein DFH06DRAFT_1125478 [Mycena polygramma]|nr:hypothetical protein DFH06DRAFT_1125478 [Mycena polygramma]